MSDELEPSKHMNAIMTGICIFVLMVLLPMGLAMLLLITALRWTGESYLIWANGLERAGRWVLKKGPRLD